jgi:hypothetical protein
VRQQELLQMNKHVIDTGKYVGERVYLRNMNDPRSKPGKVRIGPAKTVQVNSGFLGSTQGF